MTTGTCGKRLCLVAILCALLLLIAAQALAKSKYKSLSGIQKSAAAAPANSYSYSQLKQRLEALEQQVSQSHSDQENVRAEIQALREELLALIGQDGAPVASYSPEQETLIRELRTEQDQYKSDLEKLDLAVAGGLDPDLIQSSIGALQGKINAIDEEIKGMKPEVVEEGEATGLYARLFNLENSYRRMQEERKEPKQEDKESKIPGWVDSVTLLGGVDVRAAYSTFTPEAKEADSETVSDLFVYEAIFGVEFEPNDYITGTFILLWGEEFGGGDGDLVVDEAFIRAHWKGLFAQIGREYVPTGQFDTFATSDPLILDIGECSETALGVGYEHDYFGVSGWAFNGNFDNVDKQGEAADNTVDGYAARVDFFPLAFQEKYYIILGGYFLSDAAESSLAIGDSFNQVDPDGTADSGDEYAKYESDVPVYGGFLTAELPFTEMFGLGAVGEYITTGQFDDTEYADNAGEATAVSGMNLELAALIWDGRFQVGPKYETLSGLDWLGTQDLDPEYEVTDFSQFGGFVGYDPWDFMHLGIQYLVGSDNEGNGTSEFLFQTAVEF